jgi:DNA polymerase-3 subunit alpha
MKHVELHNHTHYSVLDGASTPAEYMTRVKELGMSHMAITDHGTTAGHREFQREAKKAGIKPILGVEAYITPDRFDRRTAANRQEGTGIYNHITLLAINDTGLKNIEHMQKLAWTEGFYHKPRIDIELLEESYEGIIALSGCMSGMIAKPILNGDEPTAHKYAQKLKTILGDRFFIELMESNSPELNNKLLAMGRQYDIKPIVTSDCHMANKEDLPLAEAMLILNTKPQVLKDRDMPRVAKMQIMDAINYLYPRFKPDGEEKRMSFSKFELWLHTYQEHQANLEKHGIGPEAIDNTMLVADQIQDYTYFEKLDTLPAFAGVEDPKKELRERVYVGLKKRGMDTPLNRERIEMELETIEAKELSVYFLHEVGFIDFAKANDILTGYGRGSAVSYLTNYALGITKIDPMPYNLLPERFLSVDREDPADIDTDFAIDGRYAVKDYAVRTYPHVSNIATVGYYKDKSAIKSAAKIFKAPFSETTKLTNKITTIDEFASHPDTKEFQVKFPHVVPLARALNGRIQNFGMHAGGIILSKEPIENYVPLQTANDPSNAAAGRVPVAALDMNELADMGFIKYDLLGLRTLSIVDDTMKLVKERHGVDIDIEEIPLDDKNLYDMMSEGRTSGLFQAEASASTKTIMDMGGVANFAELVASNALVRPGAANSTVGETYINGKKTGHIKKIHPSIDHVLEETYGAVLYQEQQLLFCEYVAGMSKKDANKVRKAISKKIPEDLAIWKEEFIAGATITLGAAKAKAAWKDLEASADYAFAKAHAVGYSMLTLLTAYLKYYYPIEFFTSALNRLNTSNKTDRMKMLKYLIEAKRIGLRIKLPHVNMSGVGLEIQQDPNGGEYIRMGLSQIKYISGKTAGPIMRHRPFANYAELEKVAGTEKSGITRRTLSSLNAIGAASFDDNPLTGEERQNFFTYLSLPTFDTKDIPPKMLVQFRSLIDYDDADTFVCMGIVGAETKKPGWRRIDIVDESAAASAFVDEDFDVEVGQVYVFLISNNSVVKYLSTEEVVNDLGGPFQEFLEASEFPEIPEDGVRVVAFSPRTTKAGKKMANVTFCDEYKNLVSAMVWPSDYPEAHTKCKEGTVLRATLNEIEGGYAVGKLETIRN